MRITDENELNEALHFVYTLLNIGYTKHFQAFIPRMRKALGTSPALRQNIITVANGYARYEECRPFLMKYFGDIDLRLG